ncbi:hypothetical protein VBI23_00500 [Streptococcus uberis]|uniref:hypothetical protein n=1 Tax=Streptococcus uberis TaxID=1349 RepID=UPI00378EF4B2
MKNILELFFGLVDLAFLAAFVYFSFMGNIDTVKVVGVLYVVSFLDVDYQIDLTEKKKRVGKVRIVSKTSNDNSYNVQSKMNNKILREFLMQEYGLNKHQVVVSIG